MNEKNRKKITIQLHNSNLQHSLEEVVLKRHGRYAWTQKRLVLNIAFSISTYFVTNYFFFLPLGSEVQCSSPWVQFVRDSILRIGV